MIVYCYKDCIFADLISSNVNLEKKSKSIIMRVVALISLFIHFDIAKA